jgi:hypothetical protein
VIHATAREQGIACQLRNALIRSFPWTSVAQAQMTGLIDYEKVFELVTRLLAMVILLLLLGIFWALDRAFGPILPTREL